MKKLARMFMLAMVVMFHSVATAQTIKDVFTNSETPLTYLGIDFTKARLIDDAAANEMDIRDRQFAGINDVIVNEPKRYDLKGAFNKSEITHDLGPVGKRNKNINAENIKSTNTADYSRLKEADITALVKGFDFGGKKGVGLLFVMEGMSKSQKGSSVWVTLVDMNNKKVLMTERMEAKAAGGFGFRNYWASTIRTLIETIDKKKYKEWKQKFS